MKVWLVKIGEGARGGRPFRIDMMARGLLERGHQVRLYTSTFRHYEKDHLYTETTERQVEENYTAVYLHSPGYRRNVSLGRLWDHRLVARGFAAHARASAERPDLMLCCLPTLELAAETVRLGGMWQIPTVLDIRDPWPDVYFRVFPGWTQGMARTIFAPLISSSGTTLARATALTAVSRQYLSWALERAGRPETERDAVFGLSYTPPEFSQEQLAEAQQRLAGLGVDFHCRLCVFSGTLGSSYDIEGLLVAAARLSSEPRFADVRFVFLGDGDKRGLFSAAGLPVNVVFTGWVGQAELQVILQSATLGFMAYTRQAMQSLPNKVYEYMAGGVPMISSLPGEARQLMASSGCGVSYQPEDVEGMIAAMTELLDHPEHCRQAGENGRKTYDAEYRPEQIYARMARHLERVAGEKG